MRQVIIPILLLSISHYIYSQNSRQITIPDVNMFIDNKVDENDNIAYLGKYYSSTTAGFAVFDDFAIFNDSIRMTEVLIDNFDFNDYNWSFFSQNQFFISSYFTTNIDGESAQYPSLFSFDFTTDENWLLSNVKCLNIMGKAKSDGTVILGTRDFIPMAGIEYSGIHRISTSGEVLWDRAYDVFDESSNRKNSNANLVNFFSNEDFALSGSIDGGKQYIAKFNNQGDLINVIFLNRINSRHQNLLINSLDEVISTAFQIDTIDEEVQLSLSVQKFDSDLNIIWSKRYFTEEANLFQNRLNLLPNDNLILAYETFGAFPVILATLNPDGEIISQKGYPLMASGISPLSTGALVMTTSQHFDENGNIFPQSILTKTDENGDIDGCGTYLTCLQSTELPVEFLDWSLVENDIPTTFEPYPYTTQTRTFPYEDFCEIPPPPNPEFTFSDTLCVNECATTADTYNHFAHGITWQLTGNNIDSLLRDSVNFSYCFTESGEYELTQTIWLLGCDYVFSKKIVVLSPLEIDINPAGTICEMSPIDIKVTSSRPLKNWEWSDGTTQATTQLFESDTIAVSVSDGYCLGTDTTAIYFQSESIDEDSILNFVEEQTVCEQNLPFYLLPQSAYTNQFSLHQQRFSTDSLAFKDGGIYLIYAKIDSCVYQKDIEIIVDDCDYLAYFPNVFSPNQDGINDYFYPQGEHITPIKLLIFDRWGSLVFDSQNDLPRWNGELKGQSVREGIYVWLFSYKNDLTGEILEQSGEVLVLR